MFGIKTLFFKGVSYVLSPVLNEVLYFDSMNIERCRCRLALQETAQFVEKHLAGLQSCATMEELRAQALSQIEPVEGGLVCEFGVAVGVSINQIARHLPHLQIYGFDSFEGLPEDWRDGAPKGFLKVKKLPSVPPNVKLIKGLFSDTLPAFTKEHPQKVIYLHIDSDLYSSAKTVFEHLENQIQPGTVIVFDEFFNFPGWQHEEYRAFMEFIEKTRLPFRYLGYCRYNTQVAVKIG
jgi:predicted O-methyltransferase YrrM